MGPDETEMSRNDFKEVINFKENCIETVGGEPLRGSIVWLALLDA